MHVDDTAPAAKSSRGPSGSLILNNKRFVTRTDTHGQEYEPSASAVLATHYTVVTYPDGDMEVSGCHRLMTGNHRKVTDREKEKIEADRARRELLRVVKYFQIDHLWTWTYRGKQSDRAKLFRDLQKFERIVRKSYPEFALVGVPELHQGGGPNHGGYHFHFGVHGFYEVAVLRAACWQVVGDGQGNVQVESRCTWSHRSLALYLVKYITKEFDSGGRLKGQHRYRRSQNLRVPVVKKKFFGGRGVEREAAIIAWMTVASGKPVVFEWRSDDGLNFLYRTFQ